MSLKPLYPLTGTMILLGTGAMLYGLQSSSLVMFIEGLFLVWLGIQITMNAWDVARGEMGFSERPA
jgi:hypothetical protein